MKIILQLTTNIKNLIIQLEAVVKAEEEAIKERKEELRRLYEPYNHHIKQLRALKAQFDIKKPTRDRYKTMPYNRRHKRS